MSLDLIIIGAGPGGYCAAIRAAHLGLKTAIIEKDEPGGVCLNWGCIPSKSLIHQAYTFHSLIEMENIGVSIDRSSLDYARVHATSREAVKKLTSGVAGLLKKNNVEYYKGTAKITSRGEVTLTSDGASQKVKAKNILVATGSRPMVIGGFEFDEQQVLSSRGILNLKQLPTSLTILGAGAIGCEFAYVMNSFGVNVTLVEYAEHILPTEDYETTNILYKSFLGEGINVLVNTKATGLKKNTESVTVTTEDNSGHIVEIESEKVLVVFGRSPNTKNLGLTEMGVKLTERGHVMVDDYYQTNAAGIFAIGDITETPALAHVASKEGEIAVEKMAGHIPFIAKIDSNLVPSAIYCEPQVAGFGLREDQAKAQNIKVKKSVFNYASAGKTIAVGKSEGLVKILCDQNTGEILGAHIVGHCATELIHELLLAKHSELLPEDVESMIHAHPTISEAIMEAARGINGKPIHG